MTSSCERAPAAVRAPAVEFERLVFRRPGRAGFGLEVERFRVEAGEQVFLHGPSGSGKSTLLSLVGGVLDARSGIVRILGTELCGMRRGARDRFRAANVGFIFQLFNLVPYLSGLDNIVLPCRFSQPRAARIAGRPQDEALRLAGRLELDRHLLSRPAAELSVGQQQRVAAARALIGRPGLVIADEPTSALDADRQNVFLDLLLGECNAAGAALLFVSHDLRLADRFDRVVRLDQINRAAAAT